MRDCGKCKHRKENGCEKWACEFEPKMTIEEAASYIKKYLGGEIVEIIDGDPKTTNKEFMCVITALEVALRSFEAWKKVEEEIDTYLWTEGFGSAYRNEIRNIINKALREVEK